MPAPGEQHVSAAAFNPFEESKPRISDYTAQEIATLQSRLEKQLGPEYISSRPGAGGGKVHYVSGEKCINLANEVFGFNGWSSTIREIQVDFADEIAPGKYNVGLSVIVRVTLRDGTFHEDIGYGHIENCKGKAQAFEKAKKEGTTDALKRALRNFGKVLGLCVYDKDYLAKVTKMKIEPSRWDPGNLHRHSEYGPAKQQARLEPEAIKAPADTSSSLVAEFDDEFGTADFDEADFGVADGDHPDEVMLEGVPSANPTRANSPTKPQQGLPLQKAPGSNRPGTTPARLPPNEKGQPVNGNPFHGGQNPGMVRNFPQPHASMPPALTANANAQKYQQAQAHQTHVAQTRQQPPGEHHAQQLGTGQYPVNGAHVNGAQHGLAQQIVGNTAPGTRCEPQPNGGILNVPRIEGQDSEATVGFVTARAAVTIQQGRTPAPETAAFNPHLESPSIRKTAGIDHNVSKAVPREVVKVTLTPNSALNTKNNFVNPHLNQARRIGMPGSAASPLQNRSSYKPPQMMKRPGEGHVIQNGRSVLNDVTAASVNSVIEIENDSKKMKMDTGQFQGPIPNLETKR